MLRLFHKINRILRPGTSPNGCASKFNAKRLYFYVRSSHGDPIRSQNDNYRPNQKTKKYARAKLRCKPVELDPDG